MIYHLCFDEGTVNYAVQQFNSLFPQRNRFFVITPKLQKVQGDGVVAVSIRNSTELKQFIANITDLEMLVIHRMDYLFSRILMSIEPQVPVVWLFWGAEAYNRFYEFRSLLYGPQTRQFIGFRGSLSYRILKHHMGYLASRLCGEKNAWLFKKFPCSRKQFEASLRRANFLGDYITEDYQLVVQTLKLKAKQIPFAYYFLEDLIGLALMDKQVQGNGILLGNSATPENNHFEALQQLQAFNLSQHKVVIPLSYGNMRYGKIIHNHASQVLGVNYQGLLKLLPRDEYNQMILQCPIVVMNHHRQQAVGNVITGLWLGARVYMSNQSPVYAYFKRLGMYVYSVESDLSPHNPDALLPLSAEYVKTNRKILQNTVSRQSALENLRKPLQDILG